MLTQEQINQDWTVRSDNYNRYVEEEFATERPAKWLERIEKNAPSGRPLKILDAGCGPGFFSVLLSRAGHQVTGIRRIRRNAGACKGKRTQIRSGAGAYAGGFW